MVDRDSYEAPVPPTRRNPRDVPGALSGSRLFEQPEHRAEADRVLAFIEAEGPVAVEIGFDHGISLLAQARAHPEQRWLGFEIRRRRVESVLPHAPKNCLPVRGDARTWFAAVLPDDSVDRVDVLFPTPSEKPRHLLWTPAFVADLARVLKPDGVLHVATDVPDLARLCGELLEGWVEAPEPERAPELSRRERICRRDDLRVWRLSRRPGGQRRRPILELSDLQFRTFDAASHWKEELDADGVAAEHAAQDRAWQRGLAVRLVAAPIVWVKRWRTARQVERANASHAPAAELSAGLVPPAAFERVGDRLVSARHGCSLGLPDGGTVRDDDRIAWRPSVVFTLRVGAFRIQCTAHTPEEVVALANKGIAGERATIVEDVIIDTDGWPGRVLRVQVAAVDDLGRETGTHRRWVGFVAGPRAVLKFEAADRDPEDLAFDGVFREVVRGVRFEGE